MTRFTSMILVHIVIINRFLMKKYKQNNHPDRRRTDLEPRIDWSCYNLICCVVENNISIQSYIIDCFQFYHILKLHKY